jgi:hypothetical protein
LPSGHRLSIEKKFDILYQAMSQVRAQERSTFASRDAHGNFSDASE